MASLNHIPALAIPEQQPSSPLEQYGKLLNVQRLGTEQQIQQQTMKANDLEIQQKQVQLATVQQDQKDIINFRQAFQEANGDPEKTTQIAAKLGVGPKLLVPFQQGILEHKSKLLTYNNEQQAFATSQADLQQGAWDKVKATPEADRPQVYQQQLQGLQQMGIDISKMPPQYDPQSFPFMGAMISGHKQLQEQAFKEREVSAQEMTAQAHKTQAEKQPNETGAAADQEYQAIVTKKNLGQPLSAEEAASMKAYEQRKTLGPRTTFSLNQGAGNGLTDTALDQAAENYYSTGKLPPASRGAAGMAQNQKIMNRAGEIHPNAVLAENSAEYAANKASLRNVTGTLDTLTAFESTGLKNLKQFTDLAAKIPDTGIPWLNRPIRILSQGMVGSENMAAVEAARNVALREIARVTNDPKLSGTLTDTSRKEVADLIPQNATFAQIKKVAAVLQQDMANVHGSLAQQKSDIEGRLGKKSEQPAQSAPATGAFDWSKLPEHK